MFKLFSSDSKTTKNETVNEYDQSVGAGANTGVIDNSDHSITNVLDGGAIEASFGLGNKTVEEAHKSTSKLMDTVDNIANTFFKATTNNDAQVNEVIGKSHQAIGQVASDVSAAMSSENARMTETVTKWIVGLLGTGIAVGGIVKISQVMKGAK